MLGKSKKTIIPLGVSLAFYSLAILSNINLKKPEILITKQDSAFNFNNVFLKTISLGNKRLVSDILWVQTLLESDESHYTQNDLNNWMFVRFNNIAELDPYFYQNYLWGGIYLSIIKDDRIGAAKIFEKGLKQFPDDYKLNYNAGFNYYAQLENYQRAYELLSKIQYHPDAPVFLRTLTAKIKFQSDFDYDGTIALLTEHYNKSTDDFVKTKIKENIYSIKAEKDLKCLNSQADTSNCDRRDADGNSYILDKGSYIALKSFRPYRFGNK